MASWYGEEFAGRPTANGEIFDPETMTAAHRTLPFGTILDVTNLKNGRTTRIRINDRGPFVGNRIIDLSYAAARSLGMVEDGISRVRLEVVRLGKGEREPPKPYSVRIESEPTEPVPAVPNVPPSGPPDPPVPEPVRTIEEEPVEIAELPASPPPPLPPPSARPAQSAAITPRGWKVQAGAFGVEENATRFARELRATVNPVYIERVGGLWRVRVGPFASRVEAIKTSERIESAGYEAIILSPDAR
jgi:rare lipoprotein A